MWITPSLFGRKRAILDGECRAGDGMLGSIRTVRTSVVYSYKHNSDVQTISTNAYLRRQLYGIGLQARSSDAPGKL